jgi:hypothetical protein
MGKLVEKLQQVAQGTSAGFGFLSAARAQGQAARPAAIFVTITAKDTAVAEAAVKNGADGLIVTGWTPGADLGKLAGVAGSNAVLGIEYGGEGEYTPGTMRAMRDAGAAFALLGPTAPVQALLDEQEQFDLVVALDVPHDEMGLLLLRMENTLPVQVVVVRAGLSAKDLSNLTVADFVRLKLVFESLRFPALVTLRGASEPGTMRTLVRMGADGIVLSGAGASADALGAEVKALREELETIPAPPEERGTVTLGGLVTQGGSSLTPKREPEPEEPDHE